MGFFVLYSLAGSCIAPVSGYSHNIVQLQSGELIKEVGFVYKICYLIELDIVFSVPNVQICAIFLLPTRCQHDRFCTWVYVVYSTYRTCAHRKQPIKLKQLIIHRLTD